MRRLMIAGAVAAVLLMGAGPAHAQDPVHKLGRGLTNVFTSWIEIPKQLYLGSRRDNAVTGTTAGLFKGLANTVLRAGVGIYDVVTFPIPYPRGETSAYGQLGLPDYAWE
jgi:putative exosortase-associated protein (TIGR04073 family)